MCDFPQKAEIDPKVLEFARYELDYRRKKQWDIFSWAVTILVAVIGGMIALTSKENIRPDHPSRYAMAGALFFLTIYAAYWIRENLAAEDRADVKIKELLSVSDLPKTTFTSRPISYSATSPSWC